MKHVYFCRHGLTQLNVDGKFAGAGTETPLTREGRLQAKQAGQEAKRLGIQHIVSSTQGRAHETAKIIAEEIGYPPEKIELNSLAVERHFGSLEGEAWGPDFDLDGFTDVETHDSVINRARLLIEHLETIDADTILIVSHGAFGRGLRHALNPTIPFRGSDKFVNARITKLL